MMPNPPKAKRKPSAYDRGLRDSIEFGPIESPYKRDTEEASQWANGVLQGRKNLIHNSRNAVQSGAAARWISEAVSQPVGIQIGQAVLPLGAELAIYFRVGWILGSLEIDIPATNPIVWRKFVEVVKMSMHGKAFADMDANPDSWFLRLANQQALLFVDRLMKGEFVPEHKQRAPRFECNLAEVLAYMGGTYEPPDWMPASDQ
jgi:hypothetical protein